MSYTTQARPLAEQHKYGFTLIELLVVILIIGILAAVALPQYNKAVAKAHATKMLAIINAYEKALDAYVLTNGYSNVFFAADNNQSDLNANQNILDIAIPASELTQVMDYYFGNGLAGWTIMCTDHDCSISITQGEKVDLNIYRSYNETKWNVQCQASITGETTEGKMLCNLLQANGML